MLLVLSALLPTLLAQEHSQPMPEPNLCFGFLKAVPDRPELPKEEAERIQAAHIGHLTALGKKRWLLAAGPIGTPGPIRGILISACRSVEEANELASADPAVRKGRLVAENFRWSGPEGIAKVYWEKHEADPKAQDKMIKHSLVLVRNGGEWRTPPAAVWSQHQARQQSLRKTGMLAAGGLLHQAGPLVAVFVFRNTPPQDAGKLVQSDPLFEGNVSVETLEWWVADGVLPE